MLTPPAVAEAVSVTARSIAMFFAMTLLECVAARKVVPSIPIGTTTL